MSVQEWDPKGVDSLKSVSGLELGRGQILPFKSIQDVFVEVVHGVVDRGPEGI